MAIVNVKTHGARGDGTADDTNAFNKALRAAQGGKLMLVCTENLNSDVVVMKSAKDRV